MKLYRILGMFFLIFLLVSVACNLPTVAQGSSGGPGSITDTAAPDVSPTSQAAPVQHVVTPGTPPTGGPTPVYDSESQSTASLKYAANGDLYDLNRLERP